MKSFGAMLFRHRHEFLAGKKMDWKIEKVFPNRGELLLLTRMKNSWRSVLPNASCLNVRQISKN